HRLAADCLLIKDVDGLYTNDPNRGPAQRFTRVSYETAARLGGAVVQPKALRLAATHRLQFTVTSFGASAGTEVGPFSDRMASPTASVRPMRIALLGCGTVGGGVLERLRALPELFTITGVGTRSPERACAVGISPSLVTANLESLIESPCEAIVELI